MVDSEYSPDNYKSLNKCIGAIITDLEMLRFGADHLKTKIICTHAVKKLSFTMR